MGSDGQWQVLEKEHPTLPTPWSAMDNLTPLREDGAHFLTRG